MAGDDRVGLELPGQIVYEKTKTLRLWPQGSPIYFFPVPQAGAVRFPRRLVFLLVEVRWRTVALESQRPSTINNFCTAGMPLS
ncbi:MAG: hypothetical protein ACFCUX_10420 [Candidatus Methylacidiphilales bacterium]